MSRAKGKTTKLLPERYRLDNLRITKWGEKYKEFPTVFDFIDDCRDVLAMAEEEGHKVFWPTQDFLSPDWCIIDHIQRMLGYFKDAFDKKDGTKLRQMADAIEIITGETVDPLRSYLVAMRGSGIMETKEELLKKFTPPRTYDSDPNFDEDSFYRKLRRAAQETGYKVRKGKPGAPKKKDKKRRTFLS